MGRDLARVWRTGSPDLEELADPVPGRQAAALKSLGDVRKVDLEAARRIARQRFAQIELGRDPGADRDAARRAQAAAELTLGKVVERYLDAKHSTMRPSTYRAASRYLRVYWQPLLSDPLDTIKRAQVAALLGDLAKVHGRQAARVARRNLSALYSWAMREGLAKRIRSLTPTIQALESALATAFSTTTKFTLCGAFAAMSMMTFAASSGCCC